MRKEALVGIGLLAASFSVSRLAFTRSTRKEIGERDEWACQGRNGNECIFQQSKQSEAAKFSKGFWVQAAHYPEEHHHSGKGYHDKNPTNGRILCTIDHALEEIERGNEWGAKALLRQGVFSWDHQNQTGEQWYPTVEEVLEIQERAREPVHMPV